MAWNVCCLTSSWGVQRHFGEKLHLSKLPGAASGWPAAAPKSHPNTCLSSLWAQDRKALHVSKSKRHLHGSPQQGPLLSRLTPVTQHHIKLSQSQRLSLFLLEFIPWVVSYPQRARCQGQIFPDWGRRRNCLQSPAWGTNSHFHTCLG